MTDPALDEITALWGTSRLPGHLARPKRGALTVRHLAMELLGLGRGGDLERQVQAGLVILLALAALARILEYLGCSPEGLIRSARDAVSRVFGRRARRAVEPRPTRARSVSPPPCSPRSDTKSAAVPCTTESWSIEPAPVATPPPPAQRQPDPAPPAASSARFRRLYTQHYQQLHNETQPPPPP
eukprot:TRINITY_DN188_c1_g1_i1.p1 TRINITY_DN188_c1_g1~~TRINITY_DN188_c1_g1_i1.p1  ORF type:complete len:200 (+),score=21.53 TRINITY_DN188_c1_g1_i1:49-600(+)